MDHGEWESNCRIGQERLAMLPQLAKASKILVEELGRVAAHDADLDVAAL